MSEINEKIKQIEDFTQIILELKSEITNKNSKEITSIEEAKEFLSKVNCYRMLEVRNDAAFKGDNFKNWLNEVLSVGEGGIYSDSIRFLFELIQNVDDCSYNNDDCKLSIKFEKRDGYETIVLNYNEDGFTPENIYAITGIAESSKINTPDEIKIGEKGIGFKSVFGIAEKVWIQSGYYSFELKRDSITVPILKYDGYKPVNGTKMILFLEPNRSNVIQEKLRSDYIKPDALLNKNPVLFLNKINRLELLFDNNNSIIFEITNKKRKYNGYSPREFITLSYSENNKLKKAIKCLKYVLPIDYSIEDYKSRFRKEPKGNKKYYAFCVLPYPNYINDIENGSLYSFLPTQTILNIPVAIHAPFKLNVSREYVDPQNKNAWFEKTCEAVGELLQRMFLDFARIVKGSIIQYLPTIKDNSIFKQTNDKIICLSKNDEFLSKRFLDLPLYYTNNNKLLYSTDVVSINPEEVKNANYENEIRLIYKLLGDKKPLFIGPKNSTIKELEDVGLNVISNIDKLIFEQAFYNKEITKDALDYLSKTNFKFEEASINELKKHSIDIEQLKILINKSDTLKLLEEYSTESLKAQKKDIKLKKLFLNPCNELEKSNIIDDKYQDILNINSAPPEIKDYLKTINRILKLSIKSKDKFYVCMDNVLILSENDLESFAELRIKINPKDLYSIKIRLENISKEIEQKINDDNISPKDFLISLKDYQELAPNILVEKFLEQIQESGCDSKRLIKELLQNADDCEFFSNIIPSFSIEIINKDNEKIIHTSCNEIGFCKANLWAITNIGESTKKKIFNNSQDKTGEKGVGFKTVFGVAKKVTIHSGDLLFSLTKEKPIIPIASKSQNIEKIDGTQMDFILDKVYNFDYDTDKDIIGLCACLHNLKDIRIPRFKIKIEDNDNERIIIINNKKYTLIKNIYSFDVKDQQLLNERSKNGEKDINQSQKIICYFFKDKRNEPENFQYKLYSTLPISNVALKIPFFIDAPYELIDSRENVIHNNWNDMVRSEMYNAIIDTIEKNKDSLKNRILDYLIFKDKVFVLSSSSNWLDSHNFVNKIQNIEFLPTFEENHFVSPSQKCKLVPPVIKYLLNKNEDIGLDRKTILNLPVSDDYKSIFEALDCNFIEDSLAISLLEPYIDKYINDKEFRDRLYSYLKKIDNDLYIKIRNLKIIPVYSSDGRTTNFVNWQEDKIFTKKDTNKSEDNYYVLNVNILTRNECESILGNVTINEMNFEYEKSKYEDLCNKIINETSNEKAYYFILNEFNNGNIEKYQAKYKIQQLFDDKLLTLKNAFGEYVVGKDLFIDKENNFPFSKILNKITLNKECVEFAVCCLNLKNLSRINSDDIWVFKETPNILLNEDDIEAFKSKFFVNRYELLSFFVQNDYISEELVESENLDCFSKDYDFIDETEDEEQYEFPNSDSIDYDSLHLSYIKRFKNPERIVREQVTRVVKKVNYNGNLSDIDSDPIRKETIDKYTVSNGNCYCQFCRRLKPRRFIEVNNIEKEPEYYWKEMRIALCLECSKRFKEIRRNDDCYKEFLEEILSKDLHEGKGAVEVKIGYKENQNIKFSRQHLAEIQEILRLQQNKSNLEDK